MTKVTVHGELATILGKAEWEFDLSTPLEVFSALEANTDKLVAHLFNNPQSEYRLLIDDTDLLVPEELTSRRPMGHLHLVPVLAGSGKSGGWLALIGLVIIAAVFVVASGGAAAPGVGAVFAEAASGWSGFALSLGITLTLAGISQLVIKSPTVDTNERPENKTSYLFNGPVNSYKQGNPVPVGFGRLRVGSQIISAGIRSIDQLSPSGAVLSNLPVVTDSVINSP